MGQNLLQSEFATSFSRPGFPPSFVTNVIWLGGGLVSISNYRLVWAASEDVCQLYEMNENIWGHWLTEEVSEP